MDDEINNIKERTGVFQEGEIKSEKPQEQEMKVENPELKGETDSPSPVEISESQVEIPINPLPVKRTGGGWRKNFLLLLILLLFLGVGGGAVWWWFNRGAQKQHIELNYWGLWESEQVIKPFLNQFMEANTNVTVNYVNNSPEEYRQRLTNRLATENPEIDIFMYHNTWVPMLRNVLSPVPANVLTNDEFEKIFYPVIQMDLQLGASYVGIPLYMDGLGLFYNEDIFNAGGQSVPTDWVNFRDVAQKLTVWDEDKNIKIAGAALGTAKNVDHWQDILAVMMMQTNADLRDPNSKLGQEALTFFSLFTKTDKVWDETLPNSTLAFATGKLAMYLGPAWEIPVIRQLAEKNGINLRFKVTPIPQLPEVNITWASYWVAGVSAKGDKSTQMAAWELVKFLTRKETVEQIYQAQTSLRGVGMVYAQVNLADQLSQHPQLGAYVLQAPAARSWYLVSGTTDKNGLNDRINKYYEDAVNLAAGSGNAQNALKPVSSGVKTVLAEYGL